MISGCYVKWTFKNIRFEVNDSILKDPNGTPVSIQIPQGFYTFSVLQKFLKENGIEIEKNEDNKIFLTSENDLDLSVFGPFLGFEKDKIITKNTKHQSHFSADFSNGLREISVYCSLVDTNQNFSYNKGKYEASSILTSIPIDTFQTLNGSFTYYDLKNSVPCENFSGQEISFVVLSGGHK